MALNDFVRRSIQIVGGGIAQSTTDYFDNAITFANDVKEVIDMGRQMGSDSAKKFNELRHSGILKKTRDWFYNEGGMFGDFDFDDEEFDAGFEIDSADSKGESESSKPLSKDMMTDIAKKQTGAMYKAFGRQADLHIANTAEIVSTINTRSAELTASVNNVNNTLIQIGKRLDLIVEWTAARSKKEEEEKRNAGILDYSGGISLPGIVNKAKENAEDSMLGTFMSIGKTMLGSGMMTPEMVMSMILSQTILDKKWDKLGKKSINDIGEFINDTVDEVIQNTMTRVLTTKNEFLSSFFEDIITKAGGKNYQNSVVNQYTDKPAVFDGMTRKSIITVIPGYLNEILKAVSSDGVGREIDKKGNLTKKKTNSFLNEVSENYFRAGIVGYKERQRAEDQLQDKLTGRDINTAIRALSGTWTYYLYRSGNTILKQGEITDFSAPSTRVVIDITAELLASKRSDKGQYSKTEWEQFLYIIVNSIDEFKFRKELQRNADRADKAFEDFAKHHVNAHQAKTIDYGMLQQAWSKNYSDFNKDLEQKSNTVNPTQIGSNNNPASLTTQDIVAGIFQRLNEGVNVFVTGKKNIRKTPYDPIKLKPGFAKDLLNMTPTQQASAAVEATRKNINTATNAVGNVVDIAIGAPKKAYPPEIQEILDKPEEERTKEEQRTLDKYTKSENKGKLRRGLDWVGGGLKKLAGKDRPMGIVNQDVMEFSDSLTGFFNRALDKLIPERKKQIMESEAYKTINETKAAEKIKSGASKVTNFAGNLLLGKQETNDAGEQVRNGGVLHAVAKPLVGAGSFVSGAASRLTPTKTLERRTKELAERYNPGKEFDANDTDAQHMQIISSTINVAMSNGEFSTIDEQTIYREMNELKDADLKKELKQSVIPLMKRNSSTTTAAAGADSKGTSTIGKLAKMAVGAIKFVLKPMILFVKGIAVSIFGVIKYGFGGILKLARKGIMSGLRDIKWGAKSFASGVKHMFTPMMKPVKGFVNFLYKKLNQLSTFFKGKVVPFFKKLGVKAVNMIKTVAGGIKKAVKTVFGGLGRVFSKVAKVATWPLRKVFGGIGKLINKIRKPKAQMDNIDSRTGVKGALAKIGDKFAKSSFGQGFMKSWNARKEAQEKAKIKEQAKPISAGIDESAIGKGLSDVLESEDGKKGFFKKLISLVQGIYDKTPDQEKDKDATKGENKTQMDDINDNAEDKKEGENKEEKGKSKGKGRSQMEDINAGKKGGGSQMEDVGSARSSDLGKGKSKVGGIAGKLKGGTSGILKGIGEAVGGITGMMGGLLKIVLSIVMSLEGFKALQKLVTTILTESLKPLNEAFHAIIKAVKPILKELGGIIKQLAEFVVQIVDVVLDIIKPILEDVVKPVLEVVSPLLQSILGALVPLLKIVGIVLKVILAPFMGMFKFVLLPIIKIIGDAVQIIMGIIQIGFGMVMCAIGGILTAIGSIASLIPGHIGDKGKDMKSKGKELASDGRDFIVQGGKYVAQGAMNFVVDLASLYTMGMIGGDEDKEEEPKKETKKIEAADNDTVQNTYVNGDIGSGLYSTYGGEYQRGMGGYLNMDQRGCGPIALADMYNRNHDARVSARSLAGSMYKSGRYSPNSGTSVGDYIDTANSMGMNVRAGKVTQQSLKGASPRNPITVVGSGSDYGTRRGNNHFMNVIGTDHHGGAYVSNPLTGRVERRPASTVAGSALLGIYGSGDEAADGGYTFPDAIKEAFQKLKSEANKILGLFSMEKSEEEETEDLINEEQNKNATQQAKVQLGEEKYAAYEAQAKLDARAEFERKYPKKDKQSEEEYEASFNKFWDKNSTRFLASATVEGVTLSDAGKNSMLENSGYADIATTSNTFIENYTKKLKEFAEAAASVSSDSGGAGGSGSGYFSSDEGVEMWTPYSDNIQIKETDLTKNSYNAPLFEFFAKTMGLNVGDVYGSGWFKHYNNPDKHGVGSVGDKHSGVDFTGDIHGKPLYATTGGEVIANWTPDQSGGGGNTIIWKDSAGKLHWYMHMDKQSELRVGDKIKGGDLIGYVGNTGHSTGTHLHYTINDTISSSGGGNVYNPLEYFGNYNPTGGNGGVLLGDSNEEKIYSYLTTSGMTPIGASGLMGCFKFESNMQSNNLENSFNDKFGMDDVSYTKAVDDGTETEDQFVTGRNATVFAGQTPGEAVGYGLAQFTSSNLKRDLYEKTVKRGKSISDMGAQLDAIIEVLKQRGLYDTINNASTPTDANKTFLWKYEAGSGYTSDEAVLSAYPWMATSSPNGCEQRHQYAEQVYNTYKDWKPVKASNGFTDDNGTVHINSAADEKAYWNMKDTGSTSGKGRAVVNIKDGWLNVRKDKSINSDVIGKLENGEEIDIESCGSREWLYVPSLGGYVSSQLVTVLTSDDQQNDWGVERYTGPINSAADARMAAEGYKNSTTLYNYDGAGSNNAASDHTGDSRWWKNPSGEWVFDENVWAKDDPRWRSAWFNEDDPVHYKKEGQKAFTNLSHMISVATYPNGRENGKYYDRLVKLMGANGTKKTKELFEDYGSTEQLKDLHEDYLDTKRSNRWKSDFVQNLQKIRNTYYPDAKLSSGDLETRIKGSGDMSELDFWDEYLGWNNAYANSNITVPVSDDLVNTSDTYYDEATGTTVVNNNYRVTRGEDKATNARLKAILANTYNVRSESMEALLNAILEELKKRRDPRGGGNNTNGSTKLFDERIPSQVTRLSVG